MEISRGARSALRAAPAWEQTVLEQQVAIAIALEGGRLTTLIINLPVEARIDPCLEIARALVQRGERVIFYAPEWIAARVTETGATHRPFPYECNTADSNLIDDTTHQLRTAFACLPQLVEDAQTEGAQCLIVDHFCAWGRFLAHHLSLPTVTVGDASARAGTAAAPSRLVTAIQLGFQRKRRRRFREFRELAARLATDWDVEQLKHPSQLVSPLWGDLHIDTAVNPPPGQAAADLILRFLNSRRPDPKRHSDQELGHVPTQRRLRRPVRVLEIRKRRRKPDAIWPVDPRDFVVADAGGIEAHVILERPNISLYCLDSLNRRALFVETNDVDALTDAPFLYQAQAANARRLIAVPYAMLPDLAAQVRIDPARLVLIHSTGRCGSTLASRALHAAPGVISLSEPDALTQLASLRVLGTCQDDELFALARDCVLLQCAPYVRSKQPTIIALKLRSFATVLAAQLQRAFPEARTIFMYREATAYISSAARMFGPWWGKGKRLTRPS
jgi:hypothetical protein